MWLSWTVIGVLIVNTMRKIVTIAGVFVMDDDQRHLEEYKIYEIELNKNIETEKNPQQLYWYENRLKSVRRLIQALEPGEGNG